MPDTCQHSVERNLPSLSSRASVGKNLLSEETDKKLLESHLENPHAHLILLRIALAFKCCPWVRAAWGSVTSPGWWGLPATLSGGAARLKLFYVSYLNGIDYLFRTHEVWSAPVMQTGQKRQKTAK